ncbi:hypothetical protein [Thermoanaerobacter thermocopriae]|uniref:hypothetical protein n=1 Tax=Thermoanaerobacter thermocopriae TaxID=29350 RepID=UPI000A9DC693|nr:hypothetical protein [Thermoanaerobacter thermocopriae]
MRRVSLTQQREYKQEGSEGFREWQETFTEGEGVKTQRMSIQQSTVEERQAFQGLCKALIGLLVFLSSFLDMLKMYLQ